MSRYENQFFDYFTKVERLSITRPLQLGGWSYSGGGDGGPPGGYLGMLPQGRVAYDYTEAKSLGFVNLSGYTLVDNLNHIRYNVKELQDDVAAIVVSGNMGVTIEHNGTVIANNVLVVDTTGYLSATYNGSGHVTLDVSVSGLGTTLVASGIYNETPGGSVTSWTTAYAIRNGSLQVYWNGMRQLSSDITVTTPQAFTTAFTVTAPDTIRVDYETMVAGAGGSGGVTDHGLLTGLLDDDHPQYLTSGRGDVRYYSKSYVDALFNFSVLDSDYDAKGTILVGSGIQAPIPLHVGVNGTALIADSSTPTGMKWTTLSGLGGATVLDDLTNVDVPAPVGGQVLSYRSIDSTWVASSVSGLVGTSDHKVITSISDLTPGYLGAKLVAGTNVNIVENNSTPNYTLTISASGTGSSSGGGWARWNPNTPPTPAPTVYDEFADASFTGWSTFNPLTVLTIREGDLGLELECAENNPGGFHGVYKTYPGDAAFTLVTKAQLWGTPAAASYVGIAFWEDPTNTAKKMDVLSARIVAGDNFDVRADRWSNYNTHSSNLFSQVSKSQTSPIFFRIRNQTGWDVSLETSSDGIAWIKWWHGTLSFTPTAMGLVHWNNHSGIPTMASFDFFRYWNTDHGLLTPCYGKKA